MTAIEAAAELGAVRVLAQGAHWGVGPRADERSRGLGHSPTSLFIHRRRIGIRNKKAIYTSSPAATAWLTGLWVGVELRRVRGCRCHGARGAEGRRAGRASFAQLCTS